MPELSIQGVEIHVPDRCCIVRVGRVTIGRNRELKGCAVEVECPRQESFRRSYENINSVIAQVREAASKLSGFEMTLSPVDYDRLAKVFSDNCLDGTNFGLQHITVLYVDLFDSIITPKKKVKLMPGVGVSVSVR